MQHGGQWWLSGYPPLPALAGHGACPLGVSCKADGRRTGADGDRCHIMKADGDRCHIMADNVTSKYG